MRQNPSELKRPASEQRSAERQPVSGWRAAVFAENGITVSHADVKEASDSGASLIIEGRPGLIDDDQLITVSIEAQHRRFTRKARVCRVLPEGDELQVAVEYIDHVGLDPQTHLLDIGLARIDPACALKLPANIALRQKALPFIELNGVMHVACLDIENASLANLLERLLKMPVQLWAGDEDLLDVKLKQVYGDSRHQVQALPKTAEANSSAVSTGDELLYAAYMRQASDIHIDPGFNGATIRFRVDGQLEQYSHINANIYAELVSRLKVMAYLDIAEKRQPQDGRFSHQFVSGGRRIDVRVATLPTKYGERVTMRLLAVQTDSLTLEHLGFDPDHRHRIEGFLRRIQGMMIMTGPTGSGKTTTLYAAIRMLLEERHVNIITIEDPIEYEIGGVAQVEVDAADKVSFAKALRSVLRHDPDVIMVGEIRDKETADIAIKAALTGHMVLGTLHTNSAAATVTRLTDMGVEPYLVAAALRLAVAQRLLRRLCKYCRIPRPMTELEAVSISHPELAGRIIHDPSGCIYCGGKGYAGRIGLYELLELREDWARAVAEGEGEAELVVKMRATGIKSLLDDAVSKLIAGVTSVSEVVQIASSW
ncbi:GspE/PulE family protein [Methylobacter sp. sgz302048]|uniref:GspE/PulE family protein n=1 Tax=Methylobacter sp. sgz302048 TaxID=3455945 RepID=UPI003F9F1D04